MAHMITSSGARFAINEDDLVTLTRDEVFDTLEDYEDAMCDKQRALALTIAKSTDRDAQHQYDRLKRALSSLDNFWESIRNSSVTEFYIDQDEKHWIDKDEDVLSAFFSLVNNILCKCNVILRTCDIEFTVEEGAKLKVEEYPDDATNYICFERTHGASSYTYDTRRDYKDAVLEVGNLNRENRFFKCKECGKIAYVAKSDDEWKKAHDLQPVQRCYDCIQRRKSEKVINQIEWLRSLSDALKSSAKK